MIKLSNSGGSLNTYTTTFNHTGNVTPSFYPITHNLNTLTFVCSVQYVDGGGKRQQLSEVTGLNEGHSIEEVTLNSFKIRVWKWYPESASQYTSNKTATVYVTAL